MACKASHHGSVGSLGISEGNINGGGGAWGGGKNTKPRKYAPNHSSQQRSSPDAGIRHPWAGTGQGGLGCIIGAQGKDWAWMPWAQSGGANVSQQPKLRDRQREKKTENFPEKGSKLTRSLADSQSKGFSGYQRRVRRLRTALSPTRPLRGAQRQACDSQSRKARGNLGPRDWPPPPSCEQAPSC